MTVIDNRNLTDVYPFLGDYRLYHDPDYEQHRPYCIKKRRFLIFWVWLTKEVGYQTSKKLTFKNPKEAFNYLYDLHTPEPVKLPPQVISWGCVSDYSGRSQRDLDP